MVIQKLKIHVILELVFIILGHFYKSLILMDQHELLKCLNHYSLHSILYKPITMDLFFRTQSSVTQNQLVQILILIRKIHSLSR